MEVLDIWLIKSFKSSKKEYAQRTKFFQVRIERYDPTQNYMVMSPSAQGWEKTHQLRDARFDSNHQTLSKGNTRLSAILPDSEHTPPVLNAQLLTLVDQSELTTPSPYLSFPQISVTAPATDSSIPDSKVFMRSVFPCSTFSELPHQEQKKTRGATSIQHDPSKYLSTENADELKQIPWKEEPSRLASVFCGPTESMNQPEDGIPCFNPKLPAELELFLGLLLPSTEVSDNLNPLPNGIQIHSHTLLSVDIPTARISRNISHSKFLSALVLALTLFDSKTSRRIVVQLWTVYIQLMKIPPTGRTNIQLLHENVKSFFSLSSLLRIWKLLSGFDHHRNLKGLFPDEIEYPAKFRIRPELEGEEKDMVGYLTQATLDLSVLIKAHHMDHLDQPQEGVSRLHHWNTQASVYLKWTSPTSQRNFGFQNGPDTPLNNNVRTLKFRDFLVLYEIGEPSIDFLPNSFCPLRRTGPKPNYMRQEGIIHQLIRPVGPDTVLLPCRIEDTLLVTTAKGTLVGGNILELRRVSIRIQLLEEQEVLIPKTTKQTQSEILLLVTSQDAMDVYQIELAGDVLFIASKIRTTDFHALTNHHSWATLGVRQGNNNYVVVNTRAATKKSMEVNSQVFAIHRRAEQVTKLLDVAFDEYHTGVQEGLLVIKGKGANFALFRTARREFRWSRLPRGTSGMVAEWYRYAFFDGLELLDPLQSHVRGRIEFLRTSVGQDGELNLSLFKLKLCVV